MIFRFLNLVSFSMISHYIIAERLISLLLTNFKNVNQIIIKLNYIGLLAVS